MIVTEDWEKDPRDGRPLPKQIRLSENWEKIQVALGVSLTELTKLGSEAIITTPYFGKPKPIAPFDLFVLMPFTEQLKPVYDDHIQNCASELDLTVARGDDFFTAHSVMGDIWNAISSAQAIIADCTGRNPNVFYEIGVAHAIGKPVILITQKSEDVPFDIRHLRYIQYDFTPRGMQIFEKRLVDTLKIELPLREDSTAKSIRRIAFVVADELVNTHNRLDQVYSAVKTALEVERDKLVLPWSATYVLDFDVLFGQGEQSHPKCSIVHFVGISSPLHDDSLGTFSKHDKRVNPDKQRLDPSALEAAFRSHRGEVECVILSECFAEEQAEAIASQVPYVIGLHGGVGNTYGAAVSYAVDFYKSLNAGRSIVEAHEIASNRLRSEGVREYGIPILMRGN